MEYKLLISTDFHMTPENVETIKALHLEAIECANKHGIKVHVWLGDVFDSRISQRENVLTALSQIINMYDEAGHKIYCIPGNHDKTNYESENSFLNPYNYHPSFELINIQYSANICGLSCVFLPFFTDDILYDKLKEGIKGYDLLFGHFAVTGSRNNDGTKVDNRITPSLLKGFRKVFLGHYHNYQEIGSNIVHLGSIQQNNFGEDEEKGFWLLKDDYSVELVKPKSANVFVKLKVDLNEISPKQLKGVIDKFKKNNPNATQLRVEVEGTTSQVEALETSVYKDMGIDIKKKSKDADTDSMDIETAEVTTLTKDDVMEKFEHFCSEKGYDFESGVEILKKVLEYGVK